MMGVTAVRSGLELGRVNRWVARWRTSLWTLFGLLENNLVQGTVEQGNLQHTAGLGSTPAESRDGEKTEESSTRRHCAGGRGGACAKV